ncbi:MAG TPA: response regulator, partial [Gemmatimonadales bacterium]|nr:response regulator [Gemmatimonadales bacterium]
MNPSGTVLVVDDERTLARAIKAFLKESGYEAEVASDGESAVGMLQSLRPDVVFADVRLPGMSGIDLLKSLRKRQNTIPVIVMTGHGDVPLAVEAMKYGATDFLE